MKASEIRTLAVAPGSGTWKPAIGNLRYLLELADRGLNLRVHPHPAQTAPRLHTTAGARATSFSSSSSSHDHRDRLHLGAAIRVDLHRAIRDAFWRVILYIALQIPERGAAGIRCLTLQLPARRTTHWNVSSLNASYPPCSPHHYRLWLSILRDISPPGAMARCLGCALPALQKSSVRRGMKGSLSLHGLLLSSHPQWRHLDDVALCVCTSLPSSLFSCL